MHSFELFYIGKNVKNVLYVTSKKMHRRHNNNNFVLVEKITVKYF